MNHFGLIDILLDNIKIDFAKHIPNQTALLMYQHIYQLHKEGKITGDQLLFIWALTLLSARISRLIKEILFIEMIIMENC